MFGELVEDEEHVIAPILKLIDFEFASIWGPETGDEAK